MPIVEGQSEERSVGVLLRRMLGELDVYDVSVARPFRVKRNRVVRPEELERAIKQAVRSRSGASAVLVMLDADEDCPATLAPELLQRGAQATTVPVRVVLPKVETEAWILAAIESVRGKRGIREDAEPPRSRVGARRKGRTFGPHGRDTGLRGDRRPTCAAQSARSKLGGAALVIVRQAPARRGLAGAVAEASSIVEELIPERMGRSTHRR